MASSDDKSASWKNKVLSHTGQVLNNSTSNDVWMKTYLPQMLKNRDELYELPKFQKDMQRGISEEARPEFWPRFIDNRLKITPNLYATLL